MHRIPRIGPIVCLLGLANLSLGGSGNDHWHGGPAPIPFLEAEQIARSKMAWYLKVDENSLHCLSYSADRFDGGRPVSYSTFIYRIPNGSPLQISINSVTRESGGPHSSHRDELSAIPLKALGEGFKEAQARLGPHAPAYYCIGGEYSADKRAWVYEFNDGLDGVPPVKVMPNGKVEGMVETSSDATPISAEELVAGLPRIATELPYGASEIASNQLKFKPTGDQLEITLPVEIWGRGFLGIDSASKRVGAIDYLVFRVRYAQGFGGQAESHLITWKIPLEKGLAPVCRVIHKPDHVLTR